MEKNLVQMPKDRAQDIITLTKKLNPKALEDTFHYMSNLESLDIYKKEIVKELDKLKTQLPTRAELIQHFLTHKKYKIKLDSGASVVIKVKVRK